jgi:hypothetical protein
VRTKAGKTLIAGINAAGVKEAAAMSNYAAALGFAAALVETPHAGTRMAEAPIQLLYFRSVADRARIPVLVANRPAETGVDLSVETMLALAMHPNICGIVGHSDDVTRIRPLPSRSAGRAQRIRCGRRCKRTSGAGCRSPMQAVRDHRALGGASHARGGGGVGLAIAHHAAEMVGARYGIRG